MLAGLVFAVASTACQPAADTTVLAEQPEATTPQSMVRIGTFDSRAVAVAYANSDEVLGYMAGLRAEYEEAKAAGDEERVAELEVLGPAQSELLEKQAFSTWPVDNILGMIEGEIPGIAVQAGVDVIVSKWHVVYQGEGVEFINVTELMVMPFDPDEQTLQEVRQIQELDPASLEDVEKHLKGERQ
jgi:hypothetical protein